MCAFNFFLNSFDEIAGGQNLPNSKLSAPSYLVNLNAQLINNFVYFLLHDSKIFNSSNTDLLCFKV